MVNKISEYYIKTGSVLWIYFPFTSDSNMAQYGNGVANVIKCVSWLSANRLGFFHIPKFSRGE